MIESKEFEYSDDGTEILKYKGEKEILNQDDFLPETIKIGNGAFFDNKIIKEIVLPESILQIGRNAFTNSSLRTLTNTRNLRIIENFAFEGCNFMRPLEINHDIILGYQSIPNSVSIQFYTGPYEINIGDNFKQSDLVEHLRKYRIDLCDNLVKYGNSNEKLFDELYDELESTDVMLKINFTKLDYVNRKLVYIVSSPCELLKNINKSYINVLSNDNLPDIFGESSPVVNTLYIGHPIIPNKYIPFDDYEFEFLVERTREFCHFVQCLGATEIKILNANESEKFEHTESNQYGEIGLDLGIVDTDVCAEHSEEKDLFNKIKSKVQIFQKFSPTHKPYLPDDLLWYTHENSWQMLYKQRINGLESHIEVLELNKASVLKAQELTAVGVELDALFVNLNISYSEQYKKQLESHSNAVLKILVKFAPLSELDGTQNIGHNQSDTKLNLYKYISQAPLTDREREMFCERYGISTDECIRLENAFHNLELSEKEQGLVNRLVKRISANSPIDDGIREMLCELTGVSEEREKEIENWFVS